MERDWSDCRSAQRSLGGPRPQIYSVQLSLPVDSGSYIDLGEATDQSDDVAERAEGGHRGRGIHADGHCGSLD
jgi:hypothetical protein